MLTAFRATTNHTGENGDKKQNTLPYTLQVKVVEVCLVGAQRTIYTVTRVAPLAARPARQLSIADFAVKLTVIQIPQGKAFCSRKTAPPSTLVSNHLIFQKEKRAAWVRFSFWSR